MSKEYVVEDLQEQIEKYKRLLEYIRIELTGNTVLRHDYAIRNHTIRLILERIQNFDSSDD